MKINDGHPTHDMIATRAYQLYVERGYVDGHHEEDWSRAESELRASSVPAINAPVSPTARSRSIRPESRS